MEDLASFNEVLIGQVIRLEPLTAEHRDALVEAEQDGKLSSLWFTNVPNQKTIDKYLDVAFTEKQLGKGIPFVVIEISSGKIIGSTRICNVDVANRRAEIGYTWYGKSFQRTGVNTDCKLLMLTLAFERLNAIAVEFRTHWHNHASRHAIARLGAKQDGVLRNHRIQPDGSYRDTVVFSILAHEWPVVKASLTYKQTTYMSYTN
ncbi:GNAT family N-acetyltransferase [Thalassotalea ganghwensis]